MSGDDHGMPRGDESPVNDDRISGRERRFP
jgi:hypothetical protein